VTTDTPQGEAHDATSAADNEPGAWHTISIYGTHMVSPLTSTMRSWQMRVEPAGYVGAELVRDILRLTTTTKPGRFVVSSVLHVTRRWGNSGTTPTDSTRQHAISEIRQHEEYWAKGIGHNTGTKGAVSEVDSTQPPG